MGARCGRCAVGRAVLAAGHLLGEGVLLVVPAAARAARAPRHRARERAALDQVLPPPGQGEGEG